MIHLGWVGVQFGWVGFGLCPLPLRGVRLGIFRFQVAWPSLEAALARAAREKRGG